MHQGVTKLLLHHLQQEDSCHDMLHPYAQKHEAL